MKISKFYFNKLKLIKNYQKYSKTGNIFYSVKTNSNAFILKELNNLNSNFLINNISNYNKLKNIDVSLENICMINVLSDEESLQYLYNEGVRFFTFDNIDSLKNFSSFANLKDCKILIRLSQMEIVNGKLSHLGASKKECLEMLNYLKDKCNNVGISFYIQKNIKKEKDILEKFLNFVTNNFSDINFINIGGISYSPNKLATIISELNCKYEINLEIGNLLVKDILTLETEIARVKKLKKEYIVIINNGIYSGFFDKLLYNKKYKLFIKTQDNKLIKLSYKKKSLQDIIIYLYGGTSDSGDYLGKLYLEKQYEEHLLPVNNVLVKDAGAYFEEFFIDYCDDNSKKYVEVDYEI